MNRPRQTFEPATMSEQDGVRYLHLGTPWVQARCASASPRPSSSSTCSA